MHFQANNILKSNHYNNLICLLHAEQILVLHAGVEFVVRKRRREKWIICCGKRGQLVLLSTGGGGMGGDANDWCWCWLLEESLW